MAKKKSKSMLKYKPKPEPTIEELREFFLENDFTASHNTHIDYNTMSSDDAELLELFKSAANEHWEPLSREMGLKSTSDYYSKDHPLIALRENILTQMAGKAIATMEEQPEVVDELITLATSPKALENPERLLQIFEEELHEKIKMLMKATDYEGLAEVVNEISTYEDFNHNKGENYRAIDFYRKWSHNRAATKILSIEEIQDCEEIIANSLEDVESRAIGSADYDSFYSSLSGEDKQLIAMKIQGKTQAEIAAAMGYKTHSAVGKRLKKLKAQYDREN